jgi:hypothetical protein
VKKIKISVKQYNIIMTLLYPFVTPVNFLMCVWEYGVKEAILQEKENFEEFVRVWRKK